MAYIQAPPEVTDLDERQREDLTVFLADIHQLVISQTLVDSDRILPNDKLADADGATIKCNPTTSPAAPQDVVLQPNNVLARVGGVGLTATKIVTSLIENDAVDSSKIAENAVGNLQLSNGDSFTAIAFTSLSDRRLKDNIKTITNGLDKVNAMRGVSYTMSGKDSVGVIAQEMAEVIPEVVITNDDGMLSVSYMHLVGVLIESIKELSAKVEKLNN